MKSKILFISIIGIILFVVIFIIFSVGFKKREIIKTRIPVSKEKAKPVLSLSQSKLTKEADSLMQKGDYFSAKAKYQELINNFPNSDKISDWQKAIEDLNTKMILNGIMCDGFTIYEVKEGDSLNKLAKQFNTTIELIKKSNHLTKDVITKGQKLKIWTKKFSCFVDKSQNTLLLKSGDEVIKTYVVATGINNSTPIGTFHIVNKIINPTWYKNGQAIAPNSPQNILGTRWIGFDLESYGIHGTTDTTSLGKQATQGCVRMRNEDVEELYIFLPSGSEVTVVD